MRRFIWILVSWSVFAQETIDTKVNTRSLDQELTRIHDEIKAVETKISERWTLENDLKSKWTSIPSEFASFVWNGPQSFYIGLASGAGELVVYGLYWRSLRLRMNQWTHELSRLSELENAEFDFVKSGTQKSARMSFKMLADEWMAAEENLAKSIAQLAEETHRALWTQADTVSSGVREKVLAIRAHGVMGKDTIADSTAGLQDLPTAISRHTEAFDNYQRAMSERDLTGRVLDISRRKIPAPVSSTTLAEAAVVKTSTLPVGDGIALELRATPGVRAAQIEFTRKAFGDIKSSISQSVERTRFKLRPGTIMRRAALPLLLIAMPVVAIAVSLHYDTIMANENRLIQQEAIRQLERENYTTGLVHMLNRPFLTMVIDSWRMHPKLRFLRPPFQNETNPRIHNPDLNVVAGLAYLSVLELRSEGRNLNDGNSKLSMAFLTRFYEKVVSYARSNQPALNRFKDEELRTEIIPDLVIFGNEIFGRTTVKSVQKTPESDSDDSDFSLKH